MYFSFWIYLAIEKYTAKKRLEIMMNETSEYIDIKNGNYILTVSGIYGKVLSKKNGKIELELEDGARVLINEHYILQKIND